MLLPEPSTHVQEIKLPLGLQTEVSLLCMDNADFETKLFPFGPNCWLFGKPPAILSTCLDPHPPIFCFLLLHPFELQPETHFSGCVLSVILHTCLSTHVSLYFRGWGIHGAFLRWSLVLTVAKP